MGRCVSCKKNYPRLEGPKCGRCLELDRAPSECILNVIWVRFILSQALRSAHGCIKKISQCEECGVLDANITDDNPDCPSCGFNVTSSKYPVRIKPYQLH
jgi:hypothetical protein